MLSLALGACDTFDPTSTSAQALDHENLERVVAIGPSRSLFPENALFTPDKVEDMVREASPSRGGAVVVVPLVFDRNDNLYSPLGFNLALDSLLDAQRSERSETIGFAGEGGELGDVYFTDYETFEAVVETQGPSRTGSPYASMYPGRLGPVTTLGDSEAKQAAPLVQHWDPYSCMDNPKDCPNPPPSNPPSIITGGGGLGPLPPSGRYNANMSTHYAAVPTWPTLWKGDVISGNAFGGNPFGHTSIITRFQSGANTGGNFTLSTTFAMEAVGERGNVADEVVERPARTYWLDENSPEDVYVRFHHDASWNERTAAVQYALNQDPDPYGYFSVKSNQDEWYCSKLIWRAYLQATGDDLDHDWGIWVFPGDLEYSGHLRTVYRFRYQA